MNIYQHATAIEDAIVAASEAGFELDNGYGNSIPKMELNVVDERGEITDSVRIYLPDISYM